MENPPPKTFTRKYIRCPKCTKPIPMYSEECPECGVVIQKILNKKKLEEAKRLEEKAKQLRQEAGVEEIATDSTHNNTSSITNESTPPQKKKNTGCGCLIAIIIIIMIMIAMFSDQNSSKYSTSTKSYTSTTDCYSLGYKYGRCGTMSMKGLTCDPDDDIIMPVECRGKEETARGMEAGIKSAY